MNVAQLPGPWMLLKNKVSFIFGAYVNPLHFITYMFFLFLFFRMSPNRLAVWTVESSY